MITLKNYSTYRLILYNEYMSNFFMPVVIATVAALSLATVSLVLFQQGDKERSAGRSGGFVYNYGLSAEDKNDTYRQLKEINNPSKPILLDDPGVETIEDLRKGRYADIPQNVTPAPKKSEVTAPAFYGYNKLFSATYEAGRVNIDYSDNSYGLATELTGYDNLQAENFNNASRQDPKKDFVNALGDIFIRENAKLNRKSDMQALSSWVNRGDVSAKQVILNIADVYEGLASKVEEMKGVPKEGVYLQVKISNSYKQGALAMRELLNASDDAQKYNLLMAYNKAAEEMAKAFVAVKDYIDINNLEFSQGEQGSIFVLPFGF